MARTGFRQVELFGGAITADLPEEFGDVSLIRPVPSHQEVYLSGTGSTSLILEITQRVTHTPTDADALLYHFNDVLTPGDRGCVWHTGGVVQLPRMPQQTPTLSLLATTTPPSAPSSPPPYSTVILLSLTRLLPQSADLLLTINIPLNFPISDPPDSPHQHQWNSEEESGTRDGDPVAQSSVDFAQGRYGPLVRAGMEIRDRVLGSLWVRDWGLFGVGEGGK